MTRARIGVVVLAAVWAPACVQTALTEDSGPVVNLVQNTSFENIGDKAPQGWTPEARASHKGSIEVSENRYMTAGTA